ncbi:hypothetical protein [Methanocella arvoryzae]|uniref:Uncharacterized protein n=1 Tax=Methanocella arvoryzae (strain DSM 22066 / NBRC 105507 / MRE50) TaxID=351160 RepID=Q0W556_METAR|nr:hypothetical protein [Methanocella arvoryzae]CAJ36487.1 hypothetical protein RCIA81 [Methanocella arvoryzae MRE50]
MECSNKCLMLACVVLALAVLTIGPAAAQLVQTGGFTRTYQKSVAGGTFVPPQAEVSETFYQYPGISAWGRIPGRWLCLRLWRRPDSVRLRAIRRLHVPLRNPVGKKASEWVSG